MQTDEIRALLVLHQRTYRLLMHLAAEGRELPERLGPDDVKALSTRTGARAWLRDHCHTLPEALRPSPPELEATANLLGSFLKVSFRVSHFDWDGAVADTHMVLGAARDPSPRGTRAAKLEAIGRLSRMHGHSPTPRALQAMVRDASLATDVSLCTYVWELRQRAHGKARGPEVHTLWRSLPGEVRRDMTEPRVSAALQRVLDAVSAADVTAP